jgi:hypothetical protein
MWADAHAERQEDSMNGIRLKSAVKAAFVAAAMVAAPAAVAFVSAPSADAATSTSVLMPGEQLYAGAPEAEQEPDYKNADNHCPIPS